MDLSLLDADLVSSRDRVQMWAVSSIFPYVPWSHLALLGHRAHSPTGPFCETQLALPVISEAALSLAGSSRAGICRLPTSAFSRK